MTINSSLTRFSYCLVLRGIGAEQEISDIISTKPEFFPASIPFTPGTLFSFDSGRQRAGKCSGRALGMLWKQ